MYHSKNSRRLFSASLIAIAGSLPAVPAYAQDTSAQTASQSAEKTDLDDDVHNRRLDKADEIVVSASGLTQLDIVAGTSVIEGAELQRELDGQIGNILEKLPGVSSSGFAPGASRPVIRGFSGERVKVLIDGIGARSEEVV